MVWVNPQRKCSIRYGIEGGHGCQATEEEREEDEEGPLNYLLKCVGNRGKEE